MRRIHCDAEACNNTAAPDQEHPNGMPEGWALIVFVRKEAGQEDRTTKFSAELFKTAIAEARKVNKKPLEPDDGPAMPDFPEAPPIPVQLFAQFCPVCAEKLPIVNLERQRHAGINIY